MTGFFKRHGNIYVYVPNLIGASGLVYSLIVVVPVSTVAHHTGYLRVVLSLTSFAVARTNPGCSFLFYFLSFVCDELDGRFARLLNQQSTLGAVLDMVTDRLSTAGLLCVLCMLYPVVYMLFLGLLFLDIFSHWFQTYATVTAGASTHKDVNSKSWLVRSYYKHRMFMGYCCISCEVLYLMLYLLHWPQFWQYFRLDLKLPIERLPLARAVVKSHECPLALLMIGLCTPGWLMKQVINCFQLKVAMKSLVAHDRVQGAGGRAKMNGKLM